MLARFPTRIQQLTEDPTLYGLVAIFRHLIVCAQSQYTDHCVLNWLFFIVPSELWTRYHATMAYPTAPVYQGNVPAYLPNGSPAENTAIREAWQKRMNVWTEDVNMNKALIEHFMSLLRQEHRDLNQNTLIGNLNSRFGDTFNYFIVSTVFVMRWNSSKAAKG